MNRIALYFMLLLSACKKKEVQKEQLPKRLNQIMSSSHSVTQTWKTQYDIGGKISALLNEQTGERFHYEYADHQLKNIEHFTQDKNFKLSLKYDGKGELSELTISGKKNSSYTMVMVRNNKHSYLLSREAAFCGLKFHLSEHQIDSTETTAYFYKSKIRFKYAQENDQVFGTLIELLKLSNPLVPGISIYMNEMLELCMFIFTKKRLLRAYASNFQTEYSYIDRNPFQIIQSIHVTRSMPSGETVTQSKTLNYVWSIK